MGSGWCVGVCVVIEYVYEPLVIRILERADWDPLFPVRYKIFVSKPLSFNDCFSDTYCWGWGSAVYRQGKWLGSWWKNYEFAIPRTALFFNLLILRIKRFCLYSLLVFQIWITSRNPRKIRKSRYRGEGAVRRRRGGWGRVWGGREGKGRGGIGRTIWNEMNILPN